MININRYNTDTTMQRRVLQTIFERKDVTRAELVNILGLSMTSVTKYVATLISDGIVIESGALESTGGRRTNILRINPEHTYILGIDIGGYAAKLGVVRMDGSLVDDWLIPIKNNVYPIENPDSQIVDPQNLCNIISKIFEKHDKKSFSAICLGISGMVDSTGKIIFCPNLIGWNDILIKEIFQEEFGLPVFVDTSARCMGLAEQHYGTGVGVSNQMLISIGSYSISSSLIIDSALYRGNDGFSGEIGHVMSSDTGERCTCGNYDCLELSATLLEINAKIIDQMKGIQGYSPLKQLLSSNIKYSYIAPEIIAQAIESGDKLCYEIVMTAGTRTGIALANVLNILNPELIILGGSIIEFFPTILDTIKMTLRERVLVPIQQNLKVEKAEMNWRGAVVGSAVLALNELFK